MAFNWFYFICAALGYVVGNIETAVLISRAYFHDDVRGHGSGNAGTTNMLRVFGMKPGVMTFIGDFTKGIVAVLLGRLLAGETGGYVAGLFAVMGHDYPLLFGLKGGKGVATSLGIAWMISPVVAAVATVCGFAIIYISQMVSLGSLAGFFGFAAAAILLNLDNVQLCVLCGLLMALMLVRHVDNIRRIANGTENKLFKRRQRTDRDDAQ